MNTKELLMIANIKYLWSFYTVFDILVDVFLLIAGT